MIQNKCISHKNDNTGGLYTKYGFVDNFWRVYRSKIRKGFMKNNRRCITFGRRIMIDMCVCEVWHVCVWSLVWILPAKRRRPQNNDDHKCRIFNGSTAHLIECSSGQILSCRCFQTYFLAKCVTLPAAKMTEDVLMDWGHSNMRQPLICLQYCCCFGLFYTSSKFAWRNTIIITTVAWWCVLQECC